jgi:hypothetical protein
MAWARVATLESRFEADLVEKALSERGIGCLIREHRDGAYDGLYLPQQGWGSLWAEPEDAGRAAEVLEEVRRAYAMRVV